MAYNTLERLVDRLDQASHDFGPAGAKRISELLLAIERRDFSDAELLIRFHEQLLFIRAYPPGRAVFQIVEKLLSTFHKLIARLLERGVDPAIFDYIENSGIAGTSLHGRYSYGIARWLARRYAGRVEVDWDRYEKNERLGYVWPRFLPLLEEDSLVEQNIPYLTWLHAAKKRRTTDLAYLIEQFESLPVSEKERSALFDSLELWIRWDLGESKASRTNNRTVPRRIYYHTEQLIRRSD